MSTKNHKPATSDILSNPQIQESNNPFPSPSPTNPTIHKSNNPFPLRARCGKVARLPKEIRDQLNRMLLDGVPHAQIIQKLHQTLGSSNSETPADTESNVLPLDPASPSNPTSDSGHASRITHHESSSNPASSIEHPVSPLPARPASSIEHLESLQSLTPLNITNWKKFGGYRDWLRDQQRVEECKIRHELTLDLARSSEGLASYQAAPKVAVAQICQTIIDLGPEGIKDAMKESPLNCFRLLNALARLVNSGLKCEQVVAQQRPVPEKGAGFTPPVIEKMENALNMM
jgi:hypothetical protein